MYVFPEDTRGRRPRAQSRQTSAGTNRTLCVCYRSRGERKLGEYILYRHYYIKKEYLLYALSRVHAQVKWDTCFTPCRGYTPTWSGTLALRPVEFFSYAVIWEYLKRCSRNQRSSCLIVSAMCFEWLSAIGAAIMTRISWLFIPFKKSQDAPKKLTYFLDVNFCQKLTSIFPKEIDVKKETLALI